MSWSVTINDLDTVDELPEYTYQKLSEDNPDYDGDSRAAFMAAKSAGLVTATLSGGRTPSPYGGPDSVVISIVGFSDRREGHAVPPIARRDFNAQVIDNILAGPDPEEE